MLDEPTLPDQEQAPPQQAGSQRPASFNRRWIAIAIGGGCALLACLALAVVLIGGLIAPQFTSQLNRLISGASGTPTLPAAAATKPVSSASMQQSGNTMGDPNAPVKLVEYADFQCPYCRLFWQETEPQIVEQYVKTGKVYYEYRSVGAFIGPESAAAAEAAYCAGDQGKFWEYHDVLFTHWTGENVGDFSTANLQKFAAALSLDTANFNDCLRNGKYASRLQDDVSSARSAGIRATPSFLINGKLIEGAEPFSVFQQAIEAALQGK